MVDAKSELEERVRQALEQDLSSDEATIDVVSQGGVVTLKGRVETDKQRRLAGEIARRLPGVVEVINDLQAGEADEEVENPTPATLAGDESQTGIPDTLP